MTEKSYFWETTTGTGDSNTSGYDDATFFQLLRGLFSRTANLGGVSPDYQNELAVSGTSSPVAVNTGAAVVYGIPYFNTASVNVAVATPASSTRIDRIVLRADWTAETVRITKIAGTEGGAEPSLTQSAGTTWDIPLAKVSITTGGIITLTDEREWVGGVGDSVVITEKLAANAVSNAKLAQAAANTMKGNFTGSLADETDTSVSTVLAQYVHSATGKSALVSADEFLTVDSEASNVLKKVSFDNLLTSLNVVAITTGTFTPGLAFSVSSTGVTYTTHTGRYLKVGKLVFIEITIELSSKGSASGDAWITGLPFTANTSHIDMINNCQWQNLNTAAANVIAITNAGDTIAFLYLVPAAGATSISTATLDNGDLTNTSAFYISGWFSTD